MLTIKEYKRATSLEEAWQLNQNKRNCILGGMMWMRLGKRNVQTAIDLSDLGLDQIEEDEKEFRIGSMVTLRQLEQHAGLLEYTQGEMKEALRHIVGVQFRNLATVGGSIYGRFGFSDVLTMFSVMDCDVELYHAGIVPIESFIQMKDERDILVRLIVRKTPGKFTYQSVRNTQTDFPVLTCATALCDKEVTIAIGARPSRAVVLHKQISDAITSQEATSLGEQVAAEVTFSSNTRGSKEYRARLAKTLTMRAMCRLGGITDVD